MIYFDAIKLTRELNKGWKIGRVEEPKDGKLEEWNSLTIFNDCYSAGLKGIDE